MRLPLSTGVSPRPSRRGRRLGAAALAVSLAGGTALVAPSSAQAAPVVPEPNYYGAKAAGWLAGQLSGGLLHNDEYDFDDYGLSLDAYTALVALDRPAAAASILSALAADPNAYIQYDGTTYTGSAAKLAVAAEQAGANPGAFGGQDLIGRIEQGVRTAPGAEQGHATDTPTPAAASDYSSTITQAYVVRALEGADSSRAASTLTFLLKQQCAAGFFRAGVRSTDGSFGCDTGASGESHPDVDSTAFAVQALVAARADGVTGLDAAITRAGDWLASAQNGDGSFTGNGQRNTNTTGLAAQALLLVGRPVGAERAAAWVARRAVTHWLAADHSKLRSDVGAIGYDSAALAAAEKKGITATSQDQFRRATAQAALGLAALEQVTVTSGRYADAGGRAGLTLGNLQAREPYKVRLGTQVVAEGRASSTGTASPRFAVPRGTDTYSVRVIGTSSERVGTLTLHALGARTLKLALSDRTATRGSTETVTVSGLADGERVRLAYKGTRIWSSRAGADGTATHSFGVGRSLGRTSLTATGAFADRTAGTHLRVVR